MFEHRFRLSNEPGGLGVSCRENGATLAGVPLLQKTAKGFVPRPPSEIATLMRAAYPGFTRHTLLQPGLAAVARSLNEGDLTKAMIVSIFLKLPELDRNGAACIARVNDSLSKYNPDEPRDWHGRWTVGDGANEPDPQALEDGLLEDIAYQGVYHDQVVADVAAYYRSKGATVVTSVDLVARNGSTARADLIMAPPSGAPLILVEVKTGTDPQYTNGQRIVYPMAQIGDHVMSPNAKIRQFGFAPGQWLPPMQVITIYKKDAKAPYLWRPHGDPRVP